MKKLAQQKIKEKTYFSFHIKVHKHDIFFTFFAETESLWSQGPVGCNTIFIVFDSAEIFDF